MTFTLATAGHVDHGKSTLVRALTGIDPDRLAEEKRRGMTIDLGFAHLRMAGGQVAGLVDVPGHARFVRNLLAGVHGVDAVMLVVAADEGVRPQTVEHLEIAGLLEIRSGLVVLTKADAVEEEWAAEVEAEVTALLAGSFLEASPALRVSAVTGRGLPELVDAIERLAAAAPVRPAAPARVPVDRVFTVPGFGTVVTGTLAGSPIHSGEELLLQPAGTRARVRGLQVHGEAVDRAEPGGRVAVNLGGVDRLEVARGDVLAAPRAVAVTARVDARIRVLATAPGLRHGRRLMLHTGTAEVAARVSVLGGEEIEAGAEGWVQLVLSRPVACAPGDRFVVRALSPASTLGGGVLVDVAARRHPRRAAAVAPLARRAAGAALAEELARQPKGATEEALAAATLAPAPEVAALDAVRAGRLLFSRPNWERIAGQAVAAVEAHARRAPLEPGLRREELAAQLGVAAPGAGAVVERLAEEGRLVLAGGRVTLPGAAAADLGAGPAARLIEVLGRDPYTPPSLPDALREAGADSATVRALVARGDLVRLSGEVAFTRDAYARAVARVRELAGERGTLTVASVRDSLGATRRTTLALLEHLDGARVTRRVGDERVLRER